ncbi:DUF2237 family protein [Desulfofustis limnaeus]|jgi:uncharacterized protein (DUF2237 family)|uniref:DUF2237 domain-containing protein n=1 Tax=Desulfofustis limnaeus TaxID=2740163 RepID=A0ABM7WBR6_9BACT|nr:DUF2237 domain-containing protein [Desulfofustis limnaeus]MDX9895517.1 DUF2237 domain-containing protein [Desulfofustis sp.]BDD88406.1 hypothetical protein DPPLL_27710 [Desulfofustis limnaeus]
MEGEKNVLGQPLQACGVEPLTGFHRDGTCRTGPADIGVHGVCTVVTEAFLAFSRQHGNDLSTPRPEFDFPGLIPGDRWCVCAARWQEAFEQGAAPPVILAATSAAVLDTVAVEDLLAHAVEDGRS